MYIVESHSQILDTRVLCNHYTGTGEALGFASAASKIWVTRWEPDPPLRNGRKLRNWE